MSNKLKTKILIISLLLLSLLSGTRTRVASITPHHITNPPIIELPTHFDKVYKAFQKYNGNTDTSTVITFCRVASLYELDEDPVVFEWLIGQVLLESGAMQYCVDRNGKKQLVVSNTGAVGFGQILRSTCLLYMRGGLTRRDSLIFGMMGVDDYSFSSDETCGKHESIRMARTWLSNETNNIVMWGKIMNGELRYKSLMNALVSYNIGPGGLRDYIANGNSVPKHEYIRGIRSRLKYVK